MRTTCVDYPSNNPLSSHTSPCVGELSSLSRMRWACFPNLLLIFICAEHVNTLAYPHTPTPVPPVQPCNGTSRISSTNNATAVRLGTEKCTRELLEIFGRGGGLPANRIAQ